MGEAATLRLQNTAVYCSGSSVHLRARGLNAAVAFVLFFFFLLLWTGAPRNSGCRPEIHRSRASESFFVAAVLAQFSAMKPRKNALWQTKCLFRV